MTSPLAELALRMPEKIDFTIDGEYPEDPATRLLIMRYPRPGERDTFAWYCQQCCALSLRRSAL